MKYTSCEFSDPVLFWIICTIFITISSSRFHHIFVEKASPNTSLFASKYEMMDDFSPASLCIAGRMVRPGPPPGDD